MKCDCSRSLVKLMHSCSKVLYLVRGRGRVRVRTRARLKIRPRARVREWGQRQGLGSGFGFGSRVSYWKFSKPKMSRKPMKRRSVSGTW